MLDSIKIPLSLIFKILLVFSNNMNFNFSICITRIKYNKI